MRPFALFLTALFGAACTSTPDPGAAQCRAYHGHHFADQFPRPYRYQVRPDTVSASGIQVDTSGMSIDLATRLDRQTDEVEACLIATFGSPAVIPPDLRKSLDCDADSFPLPLARDCLVVKVADDAIMSCDGTQQILPAPAPEAGCIAKGLVPTAECPCRYRAGLQDNATIVVTPSFYLYKDALIRQITGCNLPWVEPLAACAHPSVPPLPVQP